MNTQRITPIEVSPEDFKKTGYKLVDKIASFLEEIRTMPVTTGESPGALQEVLKQQPLPTVGRDMEAILDEAADLLIHHSLFNGHPKFFGYITSSAAPIGALADLLASAINPNVGANILSPIATEIEKQTVRWLAELIGVSADYGGVLVSGGNMANFTAFLAARTAKAPNTIKENGISNDLMKLTVYCSAATHTWVEKAAVLFGLGKNAIRWIATDHDTRIDLAILEKTIQEDIDAGAHPLMVIGTAGDVSTGAVDDLKGIAGICKRFNLWFHIDGAYGIPAAALPNLKKVFAGIEDADSIALDPHKWLYSPLEAGCTLVKDPNHLIATYSAHPVYYNFSNDEEPLTLNYYEYGLQNSRGFRALKVWAALQQVGRHGYIQMIEDDIQLSKYLFELAENHSELQAMSQNLSITTFRYVPISIGDTIEKEDYLNELNEALLNELQQGGKAFLSNALVEGKYCLRACIVNFRTTKKDIEETIDIIVEEGRKLAIQFKQKNKAEA